MKKIYIPDECHTVSVDDRASGAPGIRYTHRFPPRERTYWLRPHPPRKKRPRQQ